MDLLAPKFHVYAVDSYGAGKSPEWPSDTVIMLQDEVELIEPVLEKAGAAFSLVGHSYGGSVALKAALMHPGRVRALALYEPTLFSLIDADGPPPNDADGIREAVRRTAAALQAGDPDAARHFIDFWMNEGAWAQTPEARKPAIAAATTKVLRWAHALMKEPSPASAFRALDVPVLLMTGKRSRPSAHGVIRRLAALLPRVQVVEFEKLGHMAPLTHPAEVNAAIQEFLEREAAG
jgi:pimeloyl-ACP methyl ester carboxylesterase